jgi:hypothetical protein
MPDVLKPGNPHNRSRGACREREVHVIWGFVVVCSIAFAGGALAGGLTLVAATADAVGLPVLLADGRAPCDGAYPRVRRSKTRN